ncbi:diguanylate cyclase [Stutzerimonas stutzeri]|nr:diguanylate cyclase [Stutzerimonas stutzeri]
MPAPAQPMPLLLLAHRPDWAVRLRACLQGSAHAEQLVVATDWQTVSQQLESPCLVLATPQCRPAPGRFPWPLILLLDEEPEETPEGAVDWLVADQLSAEVLRRCLRYVRERCALQGTLQKLAVRDPHTGIANRQGFQAQLLDALSEHDGHGLELGYLDLDNFRHVNDALGHDAGDRLILQVVARLKAQLEVGDLLARLGGDEFALLLDTRDDAGRADAIADRIVEALAEPYWVDGESLMLGCSLGLARASAGTSADALLWHAQLAMRQAKASQGCTWCLYDEHVSRSARSLADQEGELRRALRRGELELHYQPRLCLDTGRVVGIEALVRWLHPERGLLGPDAFIPMAEESGLIVPLGYWVIAHALRDLQSLHEQGADSLHMAVNLSFRQFQDSQLLPTLTRLIDERAIDPHWLEFELTETAVMRRSEQVQTAMQALGQLGVRFSLDDFGTGFSSFVHLSNLPITLLKVDKSFVAGMIARPEKMQLVRAMIGLARELELQVVAEGVETAEQLELLRQFGAQQVQGYLVSQPLPLAELMSFMNAERQAAGLTH